MATCSHCCAACAESEARCPGCGVDCAPPPGAGEDGLVGRVLDRYRIEECIGSGTMSRVYRASAVHGGQEVAVKVLSPEDSADPVLARRFQQEARALGRLRHDSNLTIRDSGQTGDGRVYLVTDLLRGRTLDTLVRDEGQLEPRRAVRLLAQALDALSEAHAAGIVHRDFKPEHLFIEAADGGERVRVMDYGIARVRGGMPDPRVTASGPVCGTPDYMAPEQIRGEPVDERADVYAAGIVLYEMLTGSRPFSGPAYQVLSQHLHQPPEPPALRRLDLTIPAALERVCLKAMSKQREDRYPDAASMRTALLTSSPPQAARAPTGPRRDGGFLLPLLGRQRELQQLVETRRGQLLVLGPGGRGRSRLIDEWRGVLADRGERVVLMRPDASLARRSWQPVRRALAAALALPERPSIADLDGATRDRPADRVGLREIFGWGGMATAEEREFRRREAMAAAVGVFRDLGGTLVCEDVDRYDRPSVEVVSALMLDPGVGRVVATATTRGDLPEGPTIELRPLMPADLGRLGEELAAFRLFRIDKDKPLAPLALENAHRAALEGAREATARGRLAVLPAMAQRVLLAAVAAGIEVEMELLARVTGLAELQGPLATLVSRGLLRYQGDRVVSPSPTMRDALYEASEPGERAALHRTFAGLLAAQDGEPALVAHHAWLADSDATPLELLERAMVAAERAFDDAGTVRWGIRALKRARALEQATEGEEADRPAVPFQAGAARLSPRVRTAVALGEALLRDGDAAHAEPAFREAMGAAGSEPLAFALAHRGIARISLIGGRPDLAEADLLAAIGRLPSRATDEDALITGELHLELAGLRDRLGRARDGDTALIQGAMRVPDAPEVSWRLLLALAERSHAARRYEDARRLAVQALTAAEAASPFARARTHALLAVIDEARKDLAAASRHRDAAIERLREAGDRRAIADLLLGSAAAAASADETLRRGWLAEAGELARQVGWAEGVARAHEALLKRA